ncbi:MAG: hypothetical protein C4289_16290, partial [Chloroflexota bacterium]
PPAGALPVCSLGHVPWNGLLVERLLFESEPGVPIPGWFIRPEQEAHALPAILALSHEGKAAALELAAELARHGVAVLAIDVRGRGETAADSPSPNDRDVVHAADCLMLGRWLFTMRLYDAACAFEALLARRDVDADRAGVAGLGVEAGLLALHLAALEPRVAAAAVHGGLTSFAGLVLNERHAHSLTVFIPAALWDYDLPDAAALVAPRPLLIANSDKGRCCWPGWWTNSGGRCRQETLPGAIVRRSTSMRHQACPCGWPCAMPSARTSWWIG